MGEGEGESVGGQSCQEQRVGSTVGRQTGAIYHHVAWREEEGREGKTPLEVFNNFQTFNHTPPSGISLVFTQASMSAAWCSLLMA